MGHSVLRKYPGMVPMLIRPDGGLYARLPPDSVQRARDLLATGKFAAPKDWSFGQLGRRLRDEICVGPKHAMFMVVAGHVIPPASALLGQLYGEHQTADGVMEITVGLESVFGL